jgi:hypothetical protein
MPKLHELLAVQTNLDGQYNAMKDETIKVFKRAEAFTKTVTEKKHFNDEDSKLDVSETKDITTTVDERLKYLLTGAFTRYLDVSYQLDLSNQKAVADLVVAGQTIAKDVPATMLLQMEKDLAQLRVIVAEAPTLQAGPVWVKDEGENLFVTAEPIVTFTTRKTMKPVILVPATDKHPAQVEKINEDVAIAKITKKTWSGMLTSVAKAAILSRIDALLVATKKARQRANNVEAATDKIGFAVANFILSGPDLSAATD